MFSHNKTCLKLGTPCLKQFVKLIFGSGVKDVGVAFTNIT